MKNNNYPRIPTDETFRELSEHGNAQYPFKYYYEDIWDFELHRIDWHWHSEVEFIMVESGTAYLYAGSGSYSLHAGDGAFINSKVIHRMESDGSAILPNIVFSPAIIAPEGSLIHDKYIEPITDCGNECIIFSRQDENDRLILDTLTELFAVQEEKLGDIKTVELLIKIWYLMYELSEHNMRAEAADSAAHSRSRLQIMMQYIHTNYPNKITLDDIAGSVSLSKSSVMSLFGKYLHTSPVNYLIEYRLESAAKLLTDTEKSVSAIAADTGFDNVGYFCRKFKSLFGMTPTEFRNKG